MPLYPKTLLDSSSLAIHAQAVPRVTTTDLCSSMVLLMVLHVQQCGVLHVPSAPLATPSYASVEEPIERFRI
jgi:hypothetical protein